ncbi:WxL domain-containing protein [Companilactobacillus mindensis]|uniref:WxL domain-containing protein n=1 Tax=Companilactobacillus mindensis TaxID=167481 RepID=UPI00070A0C87|nr:WxL domain-containing protein [Companilactobacillus mindensis]GEO79229.1 hypothetical protein LMI01_15600 [Companilactobacillus mindensis]
MKLLKNIVRLLALVSLSLSVTPLTTAKAVTNTPIQVTKDTASSSSSSLGITTKPIAETESLSATAEDTTTTNSDDPNTSNVSVTVLSGILTLEAVPDFNFGSMMQGTIAPLKTNTVDTSEFNTEGTNATASKEGNDAGLLEVIDSRNDMKTMPGFTLSASISKLNPTVANSTDDSLRAILRLSSMPLLNSENVNVSNSSKDLTTEKTTIDSGKTGNENTMAVMALDAGSYNGGVIKANFNTPDSASLELPDGKVSTEASAKKMNSIVTWTLSAKPVVK